VSDNYGKDPDAMSRLTPEQYRVTPAERHRAGAYGRPAPAGGDLRPCPRRRARPSVGKVTKASSTGPDLAERADYLIELAARAPSVHNTQPWRFTVTWQAIELYADASRQLMEDLAGREMIISCGAALFGLRLAVRSLGYQPEADLFPEPSQRRLLARVQAGRPAPMTPDERAMLQAVPHRHTHQATPTHGNAR
jgi:Nitroreductase family